MLRAPSWRDRSERLLIIVFAVLVGSFLITTVVTQRASADVEALSETLVETAMPRIAQVAALREATLETRHALGELLHTEGAEREQARDELDRRIARLKLNARRNLRLDSLPGEHALSQDVDAALDSFVESITRARAIAETRPDAARDLYRTEVIPRSAQLGTAAMREIEYNGRYGGQLALGIRGSRAAAIVLSYALTGACILLGVSGILLVRRQRRQRQVLLDDYLREQEARAAEMEQFAGRVAHDIRNPLAVASLSTELVRAELDDAGRQRAVERLQRSLARASAIVDGLLEFARAGAKPEPGARASVPEVIDDLVEGFTPEARRSGIELRIEPVPRVLVACSTGVLASLIGNLVRNAIKYMADSELRRITIRALDLEDVVRVEVSDTGPGMAAEVMPRLFEPYFRAATGKQAGIGLGLPTVRKLAEGHGGQAGARSQLGEGSTFWFELPRAGTAWTETGPEVDDGKP